MAYLAALPAMLAAAPEGQRPRLGAHPPGAEVALDDCLRLSVLGLTDRSGALEGEDWVTVRVDNGCAEPVRYLLVDLLLLDAAGRVYGAPLWVLQRGEILPPGRSKTERYAVPDPGHYAPRQWAVRLRHVERPTQRTPPRRRP